MLQMEAKAVVAKKRPDLVTLIAVYHFVVAAFEFLAACALLVALVAIVATATGDDAAIGGFIVSVITMILGFLVLAHIVVGWGLLQLKEWARWAAIAMGVLGLGNVPLGTFAGVLAIWYLLTPEGKGAFEAAA